MKPSTAALIDRLTAHARDASMAEEEFRREAVERIRLLERARTFAFRRAHLVTALLSVMTEAGDEAEATALGTAALFRELNWNGESETRREAAEKFMPVIHALWETSRDQTKSDGVAAEHELASFENWYARQRNTPFLSLMDGEALELPLVEV